MIEGVACGTPVVSFDVCSAREILEEALDELPADAFRERRPLLVRGTLKMRTLFADTRSVCHRGVECNAASPRTERDERRMAKASG